MKLELLSTVIGAFDLGIATDHALFVRFDDAALGIGLGGGFALVAGLLAIWCRDKLRQAESNRRFENLLEIMRSMGVPARGSGGRFTRIPSEISGFQWK